MVRLDKKKNKYIEGSLNITQAMKKLKSAFVIDL